MGKLKVQVLNFTIIAKPLCECNEQVSGYDSATCKTSASLRI